MIKYLSNMGMIFRFNFSAFVLCTIVLAMGCSREQDSPLLPGVYVTENNGKSLANMAKDDVIVRVNGSPITKGDYDTLLRVRTAIFQIGHKIELEDMANGDVQCFMEQTAPFLVRELIHHKMFSLYAAEKGIVPSVADVDAARLDFAKSLSRKPGDLDSYAKRIGGDAGRYFADIPYVNAQDALLRQSVATNDLNGVSEKELADCRAYIENWNRATDKNNESAKAILSKARGEIDAGGDFAGIAAKYAQVHPEHGKAWLTVELGELPQDEDLYKWLVRAKVGEISPPIDLDDGLAIVKLVAMGKGDAPRGVPRPDTYTLVRCTVYAYQYIEHLERAKMVQEILMIKRREAQKRLGVMLTERAVLEYPNGTNFLGSASAQ